MAERWRCDPGPASEHVVCNELEKTERQRRGRDVLSSAHMRLTRKVSASMLPMCRSLMSLGLPAHMRRRWAFPGDGA